LYIYGDRFLILGYSPVVRTLATGGIRVHPLTNTTGTIYSRLVFGSRHLLHIWRSVSDSWLLSRGQVADDILLYRHPSLWSSVAFRFLTEIMSFLYTMRSFKLEKTKYPSRWLLRRMSLVSLCLVLTASFLILPSSIRIIDTPYFAELYANTLPASFSRFGPSRLFQC
jgi:hypothetical protein